MHLRHQQRRQGSWVAFWNRNCELCDASNFFFVYSFTLCKNLWHTFWRSLFVVMWCFAVWWAVSNVLKALHTFPTLGTACPVHTLSHLRTVDYSVALLWEHKIFLLVFYFQHLLNILFLCYWGLVGLHCSTLFTCLKYLMIIYVSYVSVIFRVMCSDFLVSRVALS